MKGGKHMKDFILRNKKKIIIAIIIMAVIGAFLPEDKLKESKDSLQEKNSQIEKRIEEQVSTIKEESTNPQSENKVEQNNSQPTPSPTPVEEKEWQLVKEYSGDGDTDQTTANFTITGSEWRVRWWYIQDIPNSTSIFGGNIYTKDRKRVGSWTGTEPSKTATDFRETYVKTGLGEYYLKIVGGNTSAWEVDVEELK